MGRLLIYTDGSCLGSGAGPSGYGVVIKDGNLTRSFKGGYEKSTNNRMELMGPIKALEELETPRVITLTSDSQYLKDGMEKYVKAWRKRNWKKADGGDVINRDLWERLWNASRGHVIKWEWVKGHSGHPENEACDKLAKDGARNPTETDTGLYEFNINVTKSTGGWKAKNFFMKKNVKNLFKK